MRPRRTVTHVGRAPLPRTRVWATLGAALLVVACGGSDDASPGSSAEEAPAAAGTPEASPAMAPPATDSGTFAGMMVYLADAPSFTPCEGGSAPVTLAMEGAYLELERAYLGARTAAGEPIHVTVRGTLESREGMEGGLRPTLVVTEVLAVTPGAGCGEARVDLPLEGMTWRLVSLPGGEPVPPGSDASLLLDPEERAATGSTGCNRFTGSYTLNGGRLSLGMTATTRMACPPPLVALESDYLEALRLTGSFRVLGDTLELLGENGAVARFAGN